MAKRKSSAASSEEWVAGRFSLPTYINDEDPPYQPHVILWMTQGLILHSDICHPRDAAAVFEKGLRTVLTSPMVGEARKPAQVRVADPALVEPIRQIMGDEVAIHVAPVPELIDALESLSKSIGGGKPSDFKVYDAKVPKDTLAGFHRAAARLYRAWPWRVIPSDEHVLSVDMPAHDLKGAVISIVGQMDESYGLLMFRSLDAFIAFRDAGEAAMEGRPVPMGVGAEVFAVNYERAADVPPSLRKLIAKHGWELAAPEGHPVVMRMEPGRPPGPATTKEVLLGWALCEAMARFIEENTLLLQEEEHGPVSARYVLSDVPGAPEIALVAPHPEAEEQGLGLDHDEEGAYDEVIMPFLSAQEEAGRDLEWLQDADYICNGLCFFHDEEQEKELESWSADDVEEFLLGFLAEQEMPNETIFARVPEVVDAFFAWLADEKVVNARAAAAIRKRVAAKTEQFLALTPAQPAPK